MGSRRANLARGAVLVALVLVTFLPALRAGFVWDDDGYLTRNPLVHADDGLQRIWFTTEPKDYYPLAYTSFWIQWRLWGERPAPYHFVNVLQHMGACLLLWRVLAAARVPAPWLCSMLFAIHPLNVESVAWIAQQKNTLALLLFGGSILALTRHVDRGHRASYALSLSLFVLSLLTKPLAVFWPLVMPLFVAWYRRGRTGFTFRGILPFLAASVLSGLITIYFQQAHSLAGQEVTGGGPLGRLARAAGAWLFYLRKSVLPFDLCAVTSPSAITLDRPASWITALAVGVLLAALVARRGPRGAWLALAYYTGMLLPVSGLFAVGFMFYAPVADHWAYAALVAVVVAVVAPVARRVGRQDRRWRIVGGVAGALLALTLAAGSFERSRLYHDQETLFRSVLVCHPGSWAAHTVLGTIAFNRGELDLAETHFEAALSSKPGYWEALHGLGVVYATRGEAARAIPLFEEVLRQRPDHAYAAANLARARRAAGRVP